jgi:hypothetical protein
VSGGGDDPGWDDWAMSCWEVGRSDRIATRPVEIIQGQGHRPQREAGPKMRMGCRTVFPIFQTKI